MKSERGFTLAEVMVAMIIGVLVLMAIYTAVHTAQRSTAGIERKVSAQQDARTALDLIEMEVRMASFNPNFANSMWIDPAICAPAANQTWQGIRNATANSITIEMDINDSSTVGDIANEIITYSYDTVNLSITRDVLQTATCTSNPQPFLGDAVAGQKTVRVVNNAFAIPLFRYYDGRGNQIAAASLPAAIPNIRYIDITLAVETEEFDPATNKRRGMVYSTSVVLRNHN